MIVVDGGWWDDADYLKEQIKNLQPCIRMVSDPRPHRSCGSTLKPPAE